MNKALIKKYFNEFTHWVNEGELLIGYKSKTEPIEWNILIEDDWDYCLSKFTIVINDEYAIFRKALAERKTIQYYVDSFTGWQDVTTVGNHSMTGSENYRIKPKEEQQFNVGDFVRYKNIQNGKAMMINNINCGYYYMINSEEAFMAHELIEWEPIVGELCWFTNNKDSKSAVLCKFDSYEKDKIVFKFKNIRNKSFIYCEPFLNSKPSWFKD